jgi:hypothetical protein
MPGKTNSLPIRSGRVRFVIGSPDGVTSNSWVFWAEKSGVYLKCRDNFQVAKVSLHAGRDGRPGRWRMGFEDYVAKQYPGLIPPDRDRAWEVWDEPPPQLPKTVIAFKLCFPDLELAVRPDQRKTKIWRKELLYVDLRKTLPPGWMTVATLFVTTGDIHLSHEQGPSICLGYVDMGDGRRAQLIVHGDPEADIYERINNRIAESIVEAQQKGVAPAPDGFAYVLGKSSEGYRYLVGGRMSEAAQIERTNRRKVVFLPIKGQYSQFVMENKPTSLKFTYDHSPDFSVRYADGVTVQAMPGGTIYMTFFLERLHELDDVTHELSAYGKLSKETGRTVKEGVCRQLQVAIVANPNGARAIANGILNTLD